MQTDADVGGSEADRQKREQTVVALRSTIGLQRYPRGPAADEHDHRYISGTINVHGFITGLLAEIRQIPRSAMQSNDDAVGFKERAEHIAYARGSIGLEGFIPSISAELDALRYIGGEISMLEFVTAAKGGVDSA